MSSNPTSQIDKPTESTGLVKSHQDFKIKSSNDAKNQKIKEMMSNQRWSQKWNNDTRDYNKHYQ